MNYFYPVGLGHSTGGHLGDFTPLHDAVVITNVGEALHNVVSFVVDVFPLTRGSLEFVKRQEAPPVGGHEDHGVQNELDVCLRIEEGQIDPREPWPERRESMV